MAEPAEGFRSLDVFGEPLPNFNIRGEDRVNTIAGGFLSMILYGVVLLYSTVKFTHLV